MRYEVHGLRVRSDLPLPEFFPGGTGPVDVEIRTAPVPEALRRPPGRSIQADGDRFLMKVPGVARYLIEAGREIHVDPHPGADPEEVRVYLTGSCIGTVLHQRGLFALHASAVLRDGEAIGFMGEMGAGKSTLAGFLDANGWPALGDDVCVIDREKARPRLRPGVRAARFQDDVARFLEPPEEDVIRVEFDGKRLVKVGRGPRDPTPLRALFLLEPGARAALESLSEREGALALAAHTYRRQFLRLMRRDEEHLETCAALAAAVPVLRLGRPDRLEGLDEVQRVLDRHLRETRGRVGEGRS